MYGYIYKITNLINDKFYVGQHKHPEFDSSYWGNGIIIKEAIQKYGKENFKREILATASNKEELTKLEKYWIAKLNVRNLEVGYNIAAGGNDGNQDLKWYNNGTIERQFDPNQEIPTGFESGRLPMTQEQRLKLSAPKSEEHKKHLSEAKKGKICITNGVKDEVCTPEEFENLYKKQGFWRGRSTGIRPVGYKHTEETKKKMSLSWEHRDRTVSAERREHISKKVKETTNNPKWKAKHSIKMKEVNTTKGKHWYNNGKEARRFNAGEEPKGWEPGNLPPSAETRLKISKAGKGKTRSIETRLKISKALKGKNKGKIPANAVKIYCIEYNKIYSSYEDAMKQTGLCFITIQKAIKTGIAVGWKLKLHFKIWEN